MTLTDVTRTVRRVEGEPLRWRIWAVVRATLLLLGLPSALIAVWWIATSDSTNFYWPPLREIVGIFPATWFEGAFVAEVLPSLGRLALGYSLALVLGIAAGIAIGSSTATRDYTEPVLSFFRAIPPPILAPLLILFFGIDDGMKIVLIAIGCSWPILLNTIEGVRAIDEVLRDTGRCYRLRARTRLFTLILPAASPQIVAGARQALSLGIILMVISEMFAASSGLGFTILQFQQTFALREMWSGIILLGLIGVALELISRLVERRVLGWYIGLRRIQQGGN